jgi:hypothetical protein
VPTSEVSFINNVYLIAFYGVHELFAFGLPHKKKPADRGICDIAIKQQQSADT